MAARRAWLWMIVAGMLALGAFAAPASAQFDRVTVEGVPLFDATLGHSVPTLRVERGGQTLIADFRNYYQRSGGLERWGYPTSEVCEEEPGNLVQYYQRGVVDWHARPGVTGYVIERRLTWDYFGGDRSGGNDLGFEETLLSTQPGDVYPDFKHRVSDIAIDGTTRVNFKRFFDRLGGTESFGVPKTEARYDDSPLLPARHLTIPGATPHFIRQYFQAAVFEYQPSKAGTPFEVELRLLGDDLRDRNYPDQAWKAYACFRDAEALPAGQAYAVERIYTGARPVVGVIGFATSLTQLCSATSWQAHRPYCGESDFKPAPVLTQIRIGDVIRNRPAVAGGLPLAGTDDAAELRMAASLQAEPFGSVVEQVKQGVIVAIDVLSDATRLGFGPALGMALDRKTLESGQIAVLEQPGQGAEYATDEAQAIPDMTLFFLSVQRQPPAQPTTLLKVQEGRVAVTLRANAQMQRVNNGQQATIARTAIAPAPIALTGLEQAQLNYLQSVRNQLGRPPGRLPPPPSQNPIP